MSRLPRVSYAAADIRTVAHVIVESKVEKSANLTRRIFWLAARVAHLIDVIRTPD
jgi:hypothetical protein